MAISSKDINPQGFSIVKKGYDVSAVNSFLDMLAGQFAELENINREQEARIKSLEYRVNEFKEKQNAITAALLEANELKTQIISKANSDAEDILKESLEKLNAIKEDVEQLTKEKNTIKDRIRGILEAQLIALDKE